MPDLKRIFILAVLLVASNVAAGGEVPAAGLADRESVANWRCCVELTPPANATGPLIDFVLPPAVFDMARLDLQDLRLYLADGRESPYALRVRVEKDAKEPIPAVKYNVTEGSDGSSEVTLDLQRADVEHNEVEVGVSGNDYRRLAELEGSDDGNAWRPVQKQTLVCLERGKQKLRDDSISYPPSRYRYLRLRVFRDPLVDKTSVKIEGVSVLRRVELPGERVRLPAKLGERTAVRTSSGWGSAWILDLGGDQTPVDQLEIDIADPDFVRDYTVEAGGPPDSRQRFLAITSGVLRRRAGEQTAPLKIEFNETRAARLRLLVTDNRNAKLTIRGVNFLAPVRQVVCAKPASSRPLRLYFGYPKAGLTAYDFARNLPERLNPEPARGQVGPRLDNPDFVPEPLPFSERWPALIYAVLATVILVLGIILIRLSRAAIKTHDRMAAEA
jgi:hypothetical protein